METRDYSKLLPTKPPEGTLEWLLQKSTRLKREFLIYRAVWYTDPLTDTKKKGVEVKCSACGERVICDRVAAERGCRYGGAPAPFGFRHPGTREEIISGNDTMCPNCGVPATARHIGSIPGGICSEAWAMTAGRFEDKLVLYGWLFQRNIDKDGHSEYEVLPYEAYVIEKKKIVRLMGYMKFMTTVQLFGRWEQRKNYLDNWGGSPHFYPFAPQLLVGSVAENSKLDLYLREAKENAYPVTYMKLWQKHPQVENLLVQGAGKLLTEWIEAACTRYSYERQKACPKLEQIDWKQKRPAQMLRLDKNEFRQLVRQRWEADEYEAYVQLKSAERVDPVEAVELMRAVSCKGVARLAGNKHRGAVSVMRCMRYLAKQKERRGCKVDADYLMDYWRMAAYCEYDLNDMSLKLPRDLRHAHDKAVKEEKDKRDTIFQAERKKKMEARVEAFRNQCAQLQPFVWEKDGILIRPCETEEELIQEGDQLSHCVGGYAERVAKGETAIFFIRRIDEPEKPWYTLQLDTKSLRVVQNRGKKNCGRTAEVEAFETDWLNWLKVQRAAGRLDVSKKKSKKKKEGNAA